MKKETKFLWGWKHYEPQPDPSMTRERAAKLLRSWRRSRTQGNRDFNLQRKGKGIYLVSARGYENDPGTMVIRKM